MTGQTGMRRAFLLLQGPHGPFFHSLARMLRQTGAVVWRVGFNAGDRAFWPARAHYIAFRGRADDWPDRLCRILAEKAITDIVLYGDTRPIHAHAIRIARAEGVTVHVFEEGYMRPYWVTYERDGANGHSRLMDIGLPEMRAALEHPHTDSTPPPASWGDMRQHIFYGALYHGVVLCLNHGYRGFRPHRALSVGQEFSLYLKRLLMMPAHMVGRHIATRRIRRGAFPTMWPCCNWNTTLPSRRIRPSQRRRNSSRP